MWRHWLHLSIIKSFNISPNNHSKLKHINKMVNFQSSLFINWTYGCRYQAKIWSVRFTIKTLFFIVLASHWTTHVHLHFFSVKKSLYNMFIDPFSIIQSVREQSHSALKVNVNKSLIKIDRASHTTTTNNKMQAK